MAWVRSVGIVLGVLVGAVALVAVVGMIVAGGVLVAYEDTIAESVPRPLYAYEQQWPAGSPQTDVREDRFDVGGRVRDFKVAYGVAPASTGCAKIELVAPDGKTHGLNGNGCAKDDGLTTFVGTGKWTVRYTFVAFAGSVDVEAYGFEEV